MNPWGLLVSAISTVFTNWMDLSKAKVEAEKAHLMRQAQSEADWDLEAIRQAQYSWKDEVITIIWFSPLVVAWFFQEEALEWVGFVGELPTWYQIGMFGIMAASFGLRWFFKDQALKITSGKGK